MAMKDYKWKQQDDLERDYEYSEGMVSGEELAKEIQQDFGIVYSDKLAERKVKGRMDLPNTPIHFSSQGAHCYCGFLMLEEPVNQKDFTIKVCCMNRSCDQFGLDKVVKLPSTTEYQVISPTCE